MKLDLEAFFVLLLGPASALAGLAFGVKFGLEALLRRGIAKVEQAGKAQLAHIQAEAQARNIALQASLGDESEVARERRARDLRIRLILDKWRGPTIEAIDSLTMRINNILDEDLFPALCPTFEPSAEWSMTHEYAMTSTLFLFARYFSLRAALVEELGDDYFQARTKEEIVARFYSVNEPLSAYPYPKEVAIPDRQVFTHQQDAIGALVRERAEGCSGRLSFASFTSMLGEDDPHVTATLRPLKEFLIRLRPQSSTGVRLFDFRVYLVSLREELHVAFGSPAD